VMQIRPASFDDPPMIKEAAGNFQRAYNAAWKQLESGKSGEARYYVAERTSVICAGLIDAVTLP
jgi:hypothetical protein